MGYSRYPGEMDLLKLGVNRRVVLAGLPLPALARLLVQLIQKRPQIIIAAVPTTIMAEDLVGDLNFFWPEGQNRVHLFPEFEAKPFLPHSTLVDRSLERQWTLTHLASGDSPRLVVAAAQALLKLVPTPQDTQTRLRHLKPGVEIDLIDLKNFLIHNGFTPVGQVESWGDFSARGNIIDIFPASSTHPARVELFDNLVESIRSFRIEDQRSVGKLESLTVTPAREFSYDPVSGATAAERLVKLARHWGWHDLLWKPLAEKFRAGEVFNGLESWAPLFTKLSTLEAYLNGTNSLIYEPEDFLKTGEAAWLSLANHYERLKLEERPHLEIERTWRTPREMLDYFTSTGSWRARHLGIPEIEEPNTAYFQVPVEMNTNLKAEFTGARGGIGFLTPLATRLKSLIARGFETHLVSRSSEQSQRLAKMLAEYDLTILPQPKATAGEKTANLSLEVGQLSGGFALNYEHLAYITEDEIFGQRQPSKRRLATAESGLRFASMKDLTPGDYVVHNLHGIGQYQGLVTLNLSYGQKGDFLHLVYKGGDKLYVPVELFGAVGKYVGSEDRPPSLDRLGGLSWDRVKAKVKENIRQMAEDLLRLYAARQTTVGHAYEQRDSLFLEFEAAFEYAETPDQKRAIDEVLANLAAPRPMDRLICGDVGYGKTEVAMRAAFQVVSEKKQVAVLVPTTILAEQHEQTFNARLSPWGLKTASISRFKKSAEIKTLLNKVATGQLDVLIGTHRLLQKDVHFKDLGLVIIDEEHRFGVRDKEKLKKLRTEVDVLALSATPIPRSLSMSLAGIRDFSSISTPPQDRLAVKTTLLKYEDEAVCEAIDHELARGGQVFLVHNRVQDIHLLVNKLRHLMPLVRFGVGHGQMKDHELEGVLGKFLNRELDVWITTAIVESGLDFPSVGTIIINQADRFGLAQLYQLRGRVGRGRQQSYAYLMVNNPDTLTTDAKKRLKAILDHTELGSGYQIARHDLEIRGSGSILGAAQSGQAQLVGYEMYTQMMEEAVRELKGQKTETDLEPEVVLGLPSYLPEKYVPDTSARLLLYRRLATAKTLEEIEALREEMCDRFGPLPEEAQTLTAIMEIKINLKKTGVTRLETGSKGLTLTFGSHGPANYERVIALVMDKKRQVRLSPSGKLFVDKMVLRSRVDLENVKFFLSALSSETQA
ncbi:MAG: transcription-repair coupling factor [Candidatus Adiutrix intracellularis]|nr:transcription-repair coupling factor [Candidatus Adiutrix intracellularis]